MTDEKVCDTCDCMNYKFMELDKPMCFNPKSIWYGKITYLKYSCEHWQPKEVK